MDIITAVGIFYTLSLEFLILFFIISFVSLPISIMNYRRLLAWTTILVSFVFGVAGGVLWSVDEGFAIGHYAIAFFPGLMVLMVPLSLLFGGHMIKREDVKIINMPAGSYTLGTRTQLVGTQMMAINYAYFKDTIIRFAGGFPTSPVAINAFCVEEGNGYLCTGFEYVNESKRTGKDIIELIYSIAIIASALAMPLFTTPTLKWYLKNGQGENPHFSNIIMCFTIILFGGLRKLYRNGKDGYSKFMRITATVLFYMMILALIIRLVS